MKLKDICYAVYPACPKIKSHKKFIDKLFKAAGGGLCISDSYKKILFSGEKPFSVNQKNPLRGKDNALSLIKFFESEIEDASLVFSNFGIPIKDEPDKNALAAALARQVKLLIDSDEEDVEDIISLEYQQAKQSAEMCYFSGCVVPLYKGDNIAVHQRKNIHIIDCFDAVTHVWELSNIGKIPWKNRRLVYKRGPKDRPEAYPDVIAIPDVNPKESIEITTTIDGRGFEGVTLCKWEMLDEDGENCFPERESLFYVKIDAKFKR